MEKVKISALSLLAGLILVGWPSFAAAKDGFIQVKGSDTMVNLGQAWAEGYMQIHPEAFVAVTGGGSGTGIAALINGTCDVVQSSRKMKEKEYELARNKGISPVESKAALDGLAVVVHKNNPVDQLTLDQLSGIFTGKITNWKDLGGNDAKIVLLSREINSGTHVYFKEHVLNRENENSHNEFSPSALLMPSSQAIADEIAANEQAIGYYGMGYLGENQKAVAVAKDSSGPFVLPTIDNVVSGDYVISRPLFIYTNGVPRGEIKNLMDFILSDEGQVLVLHADFVPVKRVPK